MRREIGQGHESDSLPSTLVLTLGKQSLQSARVLDTRQRHSLPSAFLGTRQTNFVFFCFCNQIFSIMILHYLELHMQFWSITWSVCYI